MTMPDPETPRRRKRSARKTKGRKKKATPKPAAADPPASPREPPKPKPPKGPSEVERVRAAIQELHEFCGRRKYPGLRPKIVDIDHALSTVIAREGLV